PAFVWISRHWWVGKGVLGRRWDARGRLRRALAVGAVSVGTAGLALRPLAHASAAFAHPTAASLSPPVALRCRDDTGSHRMRLKSGILVAAYIRRCQGAGVFAAVRRRGSEEAGAIFIKVNRLDGTADVYGPAPQAAFDDRPVDRAFSPSLKALPAPEADAEGYLAKQVRFDPDVWIIETEDRA